jgi:hypothetical protein
MELKKQPFRKRLTIATDASWLPLPIAEVVALPKCIEPSGSSLVSRTSHHDLHISAKELAMKSALDSLCG